jgi:serine/threonine protein kinase
VLAQLGPYLIDEELAEGGMARVFRARLRGLGGFEKQLVIKQIRPELARDPHFVELFVREANILVALSHPHIVQVYELGAADGTYYLSMDYVEGATIAGMLEEGPLSPALTAHLGAQICEALDYAHSRFGILHRDITPRNIIVDRAGHGRLLDFGIATDSGGSLVEGAHDHGAELFGSPGYMSPEQVQGQVLGPESDLFALGAVLFECLTGKAAFAKATRACLTDTPDLTLLHGQPDTLSRLVGSLLSHTRNERPSAPAVARALREFLAQARPEGVLNEMQGRAARAEQNQKTKRREAAQARRRGQDGTERVASEPTKDAHDGVTARVETQSIATSPVLTEIMRSSGLAPIPKPPGNASESDLASEGTRRIRERGTAPPSTDEARPDTSHSPALTRWMLRAWPTLALLTMAIALLVAYLRGPRSQARELHEPARAAHATARPVPTPEPTAPVSPVIAQENSVGKAETYAADARADAGTKEATARASLSVNALPWAEVSIDGKNQGTTPLRKIKLRAGVHRVELSCPPLGRTRTLSIELSPRGEARMVVDLQQEPARTFLDGAKEVR